MYALYVLGPGLERYFGHTRFLILYFLSGFAGNVASFMLSAAPSVGASTAIFGLIGAEAVFVYQNQKLFAGRARQILQQIIMIAVINLLIGLSPGIDNWGHIGGLVGGTLFSWFGGPVLKRVSAPTQYAVANTRGNREALIAGAGVGALFIFLTLFAMLMHRG
jgi:rhomboid protease GluP